MRLVFKKFLCLRKTSLEFLEDSYGFQKIFLGEYKFMTNSVFIVLF